MEQPNGKGHVSLVLLVDGDLHGFLAPDDKLREWLARHCNMPAVPSSAVLSQQLRTHVIDGDVKSQEALLEFLSPFGVDAASIVYQPEQVIYAPLDMYDPDNDPELMEWGGEQKEEHV